MVTKKKQKGFYQYSISFGK